MDASALAELVELRRRAYSRDADITGDWVALERLAELEQLALAGRLEAALAPSQTAGAPRAEAPASDRLTQPGLPSDPVTHPGVTSDPVTPAGPPADGPNPGRPSSRRRLIVGLLTSVAVLAAALGAARGLQTAWDPTGTGATTASPTARHAAADLTASDPVTIRLIIDSVTGEFIDVPSQPDAPVFLANGVTTWRQPLGIYYGWALWVGGAWNGQGQKNCLLLTNGAATEAQCIPLETTADRRLRVSLAYDTLTEHQRPPDMTRAQQVTFGWGGGAYMTMEITDSG